MGEMIKFGIKLALTIATAIALCAALLLLFNLVSDFISSASSNSYSARLRDVFGIISVVIPFNFYPLIGIMSSLFAFKVAYWASDKMIQFISASS